MALTRREFTTLGLGFLAGCALNGKNEGHFDEKQDSVRFLLNEAKNRVAQYFPDGTTEPVQDKVQPREVVDSDFIDSKDVIANVDLAYASREKYPWARELEPSTFKHLVLPYRNGTSPLQQFSEGFWREMFTTEKGWKILREKYGVKTSWEEMQNILNGFARKYESTDNRKSVLEDLIKALNTDVWVQKEEVSYKRSNAQEKTLSEILRDKGGRCSDLTHFAGMMLRAYGIPAAMVRVPAWGKYDDNHQFLGVPFKGEWIVFDALRSAPQEGSYWYPLGGAMPKVYVEEFGNWDAASRGIRETRKQHPWFINFYLGTRSCIDATSQFSKTVDIKVEGLGKDKFTYLSVLNNFCSDGLAAVAVERTDSNGNASFKNVGCQQGILYFTGADAFVARDGKTVERLVNSNEQRNYSIKKEQFGLAEGKTYELHNWSKGKFDGAGKITESTQIDLHPDAVYVLKDPEEKVWSYKRPFVPRKDGTIEAY